MEEDDPSVIPEGSITRIKLSVSSNEEIVKAQPMNEFPVTHPSQLLGNPSLGLPLQVGGCESCGATEIGKCEGHFGFIKLPVPIYHPSHVTELRKILNMICFSCLQFKNLNLPRKIYDPIQFGNNSVAFKMRAATTASIIPVFCCLRLPLVTVTKYQSGCVATLESWN